jgi:predicted nucleic acid-binding protein
MVYVLDASFIGAVILPDEKNLRAEKMYLTIKNDDTKYVPCLFSYEMASIFIKLIRRKRYNYDKVSKLLPSLTKIHLTIDSESGAEYTEKLLHLSNDYNISAYDAAYLELAGRKKAVLCTLDEGLKAAARKYGVTTLNSKT